MKYRTKHSKDTPVIELLINLDRSNKYYSREDIVKRLRKKASELDLKPPGDYMKVYLRSFDRYEYFLLDH